MFFNKLFILFCFLGGLGAFLIRALVKNEFTPLRAEDAELESAGGAGEEDIFLLDDDRFGAGQFPGPPGGVLIVRQAGLDFDVASHEKKGVEDRVILRNRRTTASFSGRDRGHQRADE